MFLTCGAAAGIVFEVRLIDVLPKLRLTYPQAKGPHHSELVPGLIYPQVKAPHHSGLLPGELAV